MVAGISSIDEITEFLGKTEALGLLPLEARRALAQHAEGASRSAGEHLFRPEVSSETVVVIRRGLVGLFMERPDRRLAPVHVMGPRQIFGWALLMEMDVHPVSPVCLVPTELLVLPLGAVRRILRESPVAAGLLYRDLGRIALFRLHAALALLAGDFHTNRLDLPCPFETASTVSLQVSFHGAQAVATCPSVGSCPAASCPLASASPRSYVRLWPRGSP